MLDLITPIDIIEQEALEIQEFLEKPVPENPALIDHHGNKVAVYMARTTKLLADAKYHQDVEMSKVIKKIDKVLPPSVMNRLVKSETQYENYLVNLLERQNSTCTHRLDWCRTMVSKHKQERR